MTVCFLMTVVFIEKNKEKLGVPKCSLALFNCQSLKTLTLTPNMPSWYYMPMELFGRKGDCCQSITPQSNMGLSSKTLLITILRMALDVLTAAQGGTCAIIKTECCVYIPDYHKNVTGLIKDMNTQIKALQDPSLSVNG